MAITLQTNARDAACNAVVDLLDGGTIELQDSANVVLATLSLPTPAFGAAASGTATMNTVATATVGTSGTIAKAVFKNSAAAAVFTATVAVTGADINLSSVTVAAGDSVQITSYTHTQPA